MQRLPSQMWGVYANEAPSDWTWPSLGKSPRLPSWGVSQGLGSIYALPFHCPPESLQVGQ